jgi:hypothetical protein
MCLMKEEIYRTYCAIPAFATMTVSGPSAFTDSSIRRWTSDPDVTSAAMPTAEPSPCCLRRSAVRVSMPAWFAGTSLMHTASGVAC